MTLTYSEEDLREAYIEWLVKHHRSTAYALQQEMNKGVVCRVEFPLDKGGIVYFEIKK